MRAKLRSLPGVPDPSNGQRNEKLSESVGGDRFKLASNAGGASNET